MNLHKTIKRKKTVNLYKTGKIMNYKTIYVTIFINYSIIINYY